MENWTKSVIDILTLIAPKHNVDLKVVWARNGEDILQQLNYDFSAIVMDYHMSPSNGDKYIRDIRFEEHLEDVPIIFYSQDNTTDLKELVADVKNVITVYRPNLEDKIKELFYL